MMKLEYMYIYVYIYGVALGDLRAGIMSNNQPLVQALIEAGERTSEKLWQLPLDDEYFDLIKGDDSDMKNSGGRQASAIVGGIFLKQFITKETPWAHIDIASTAITNGNAYCQKGGTGFGVRLLFDYIENLP